MAWATLQETVIQNNFIPKVLNGKPFPSPKQSVFLTVPVDEVFYGGAARGGKSVALLAAALQYVDRPDYAALILRRTLQDLKKPDALMDVAAQWLTGTGAEWKTQDHKWIFPSGATLDFGYLEAEKDRFAYQSAAYQFVGFDELSQFTETAYLYLFSRLSRPIGSTIPLRMRSASNPGGSGHEWVKRRFIPYSNHTYIDTDGFTRMFIPARLTDNPGVDQEAYVKSLGRLDAVTRKQLLEGDWDILPAGNLFKRAWFQIVDATPVDVVGRVRGWDFAATENGGDYTVGAKVSRTPNGLYYVEHVVRGQWGPLGVDNIVRQTTAADGRDVKIRGEQEPGSSGKIVAADFVNKLAGFDVEFKTSTGEKSTRWRPFSVQCEAENVKLIQGSWNEPWLDEMTHVPQAGVYDDQADATSAAFNDLALTFFRAADDYGWS